MSIYKRKHRNGKRSRYFTASFEYRGREYRKAGLPDRDAAKHWIESTRLKLRRGAIGLTKAMTAAAALPLVTQFVDALRARGRDDEYAYICEKRLTRLAGDCGWQTLGHATRESLRTWLTSEQNNNAGANRDKPMSARTKNQYLDTAMEWGAWLASEDVAKLPANPFAGMKRLPAKHNDEYRRAATIDELNRLLATCPSDRRLYYQFRIYTPIRSSTLHAMTWRMLDLDATHPFVKTPGAINKSRKEEKHAVRFEVAQELRAEKKRRKCKADDLVFPDPPTLEQFHSDLTAADVKTQLAAGLGRLDYHALRSTLVQIGKAAGLTAFQMMDLMGWKSMSTMMKHYNRSSIEPEQGATMEKLPTLGGVRRAM